MVDEWKPDKTDEETLKHFVDTELWYSFVREGDKPLAKEVYLKAEQQRSDIGGNALIEQILNALFEHSDVSIIDVMNFLLAHHPAKVLNYLYDRMLEHPTLEKAVSALIFLLEHYRADPKTLHDWKWAWECQDPTCKHMWYAPRGWHEHGHNMECPKCGGTNIFRLTYVEDPTGYLDEKYYREQKVKIAAIKDEVGF